MEYENYTFVEALKYLADRAGVELPEEEYSREAKERADTRAILLEINKAAAQYYYIQLKSSRGAVGLEYFKSVSLVMRPLRRSVWVIRISTAMTCIGI